MYVTKPRLFFDHALQNHFAVPSFNVCNLEMARAVIVAAEAENAPVMLQSYFGDLYYGGLDVLPQLLRILAEQSRVPVLVHQDHPDNDALILQTLRRGYYSVMYDGAHLPLEENISGAAYITKIAHAMGAVVEAELGLFGGGEGHAARVEKASVEDSRRMVEESGIDNLAPAVGSVHGGNSRLDLPLLEAIAGVSAAPLVLHGGSGIHPDDLREALHMNVVKVNIGADGFRAWVAGLQEGASLKAGDAPLHHVMMNHASAKVSEVARRKLSLIGACGKAGPLLQRLEEERTDLPAISRTPLSV
ncbi:MAG TPA: class II fructose-bisphosphate aldolase [Chthoniobacterales bacterium]|jgi:fructose-bisphosphate aldolase class II|nr:class II fructose-bisphosphate aldolase [Chthoniobacterales bacterium]